MPTRYAPGPMWSLRAQYFITFAVMGCVLPYLPVFLRERGLRQTDVGLVFAVASVAVLLLPVLVTLLADTRFAARSLMGSALLASGAALVGLSASHAVGWVAMWYGLHALAFAPMLPLQDGLLFAVQAAQIREKGVTDLKYHRVRVWGTVGFIVPSLGLFWLLRAGVRIESVLFAGAACAVVGTAFAWTVLPNPDRPQAAMAGRLPTTAALRVLSRRPVLIFCIATFLLSIATAPYYAFYPIYLTETVGIPTQWVGMISNVGVVLEILFVLGFGRLREALGLRGLVLAGFAATIARFALLAAAPNVFIAVFTQVFHGMMVLLIAVVPPVFLNEQAEPQFRHSLQGLYTLLVVGIARVAGNLLAGPIAEQSIITLFWYCAAVTIAAGALIAVGFRQPTAATAAQPPAHPLPLPEE